MTNRSSLETWRARYENTLMCELVELERCLTPRSDKNERADAAKLRTRQAREAVKACFRELDPLIGLEQDAR